MLAVRSKLKHRSDIRNGHHFHRKGSGNLRDPEPGPAWIERGRTVPRPPSAAAVDPPVAGRAEAPGVRPSGRRYAALRPHAEDARPELPVPGPLRDPASWVPRAPRLRAAVGASRVPGDPRRRRSDLRLGDGPRRSGDAHGVRPRDARALRRLLLDDAGDAPAELPAAGVAGGSAAWRLDDCAAGTAGRGRRGATS